MSGAQEYYDTLIAQGHTSEQSIVSTQQHFPSFSPAAAMPAAPQPVVLMDGMVPASSGDTPGALNRVALGLTTVAITMIFIAMFSNSWMTGEYGDESTISFGLSEFEAVFDGDPDSQTYDNCNEDECPDMDSAGLTGMIFLWIAVAAAIGSLVLMCLNNFNIYNSKFGMIACFVSGGLAIAGAITWLSMFPEVEGLAEFDLSPGMAFYMAIIGGVCSIGSGVYEIISNRKQKAEEYTKNHFQDFAKPSDLKIANPNEEISGYNNHIKHNSQFFLSLLLSITSIILITVAIFSNSWMSGFESDDQYGFNFGLTGFESYEIGVDEKGLTGSYSDLDEFTDSEDTMGYIAGITALIFLITGLTSVVISLLLFVLDSLGVYNSNYLRLARLSAGGLILIGVVSWLALFPTSVMEEFSEINLDLGIAFYLALLGGIAASLAGLLQISSEPVSNYGGKDESIISLSDAISRIKSQSLQSINSTTVALGIVLLSIVLIFISIFTNSWMTDSVEDVDYRFGLQEGTSEYEGEIYVTDYSFEDCRETEPCSEFGDAGTTAFVMLWISIIFLITAMVLIYLNSIGVYQSNYGKIAAFCGGAVSILATIVFYMMFPDLSKFDIDTSPGGSNLLVVLGGITAIAGGALDRKSQEH